MNSQQPQSRKNPITINEAFICQNCHTANPQGEKTPRNHCKNCLYTIHVDQAIPGDRQSKCHGLMRPIKADQNSKKGWIIYHKCQKCGKINNNKAATDDNFEEIIQLSQL